MRPLAPSAERAAAICFCPFQTARHLPRFCIMIRAIALLNGPNLNLLGSREPEVYGRQTLKDIEDHLRTLTDAAGVALEAFQSNHEGALIDQIQAWSKAGIRFGVINPAGLTHTSVALRDCVAGCAIDFIEVHISHIHQREPFRHHSYTAGVCSAQISGLGAFGYEAALRHQLAKLG